MSTPPPPPKWLTAVNPDVLLDIVRPPVVWPAVPPPVPPPLGRRFQLLACACARMVWDLLPTDIRSAVQTRERFADRRATESDLHAAAPRRQPRRPTESVRHAVECARRAAGFHWGDQLEPSDRYTDSPPRDAARLAARALACRAAGAAPARGPREYEWHEIWNAVFAEARADQAELVRDLFPPPNYAPHIDPEWRTSTVVALARQMDGTGDFSAVPILADALQDAGCTDEVMLARCRAPSGIHSRGNWVVDSVLGRA